VDGQLQAATPRFALTLGLLLLGVFPGDLITSITVGAHPANKGVPWWHGLGFIVVTLLLLGLPVLLVLVLGQRAKAALPKVRNWMTANSWVVSEIVIVVIVVDSLAR
jgi:Sap, sulfolipid-1-addressing protein